MIKNPLRRLILWLGRHELVVLVAALAVVAGTWAFIALADVVLEGRTEAFDEWVLRALRRPDNPALPIGPDWMAEVGRDMTALGGVAVLLLVTVAVAGFLYLDRKFAAMGFLLAAVAGGLVLSSLLKATFDRPRPNVVPYLSQVYTTSFPSGHSMMSAVVYLTLGAVVARMVAQRRLKLYFLAIALLLTGLVGCSRVYMGVHYPTDVLAGWTAGLVWATLCWLLARALQRRGAIERSGGRGMNDEG
jgi:undecaprenyl-diphosphatase